MGDHDYLNPDGQGDWAALLVLRETFNTDQIRSGGTFHYRPLKQNRREVRIMYLCGKTDSDSDVCAFIKPVSLDSQPHYACLSYTWGDTSESRCISLNGQAFSVRTNLFLALQHIQTRLRDRVLPIWIDAVCINQDDENEKTTQVREMSAIYSGAKLVVAWLGVADDGSDVALRKLHHIGRFQAARNTNSQTSAQDPLRGFAPMLRAEFNGDFPVDQIQALMQRPYWYRIWIMQEVRLPPAVYCLCGTAVAPFRSITEGIEALYNLYFLAESLGGPLRWISQPLAPMLISTPSLMRSTFHVSSNTPKQPLAKLLRANTDNRATDKRDYVFGVLAMATDLEQLGIEADYTKSCLEVYTQVAASIITKQSGYQLLARRGGGVENRMCDLPSWVPDWAAGATHGYAASVWQDDLYRAGGTNNKPRSRPIVDDNNSLCLSGVLVGSVDKLGPAADDFNHLGRYMAALEEFARDNCTAAYATATAADDAVHRLAVLDAEQIPSPETMSMRGAARVKADRAHALFVKLKANTTRDRVSVNEHLAMCHYGRRVFVTTGGLLGLGHETVMEGDHVGVVPGCNSPLLLRRPLLEPIGLKVNDEGEQEIEIRCRLIGEVFVQGIMDGEALEDQERIHAQFIIS